MNCDGYPKTSDKNIIADQVWSIPQMYKQNKGYWEILNRTNCIQVPFIWSNNSINFVKKILNIEDETTIMYAKKQNKIGIFEPNISIMKWSLPSILITEDCYRNNKNIVPQIDYSGIGIIVGLAIQAFANLPLHHILHILHFVCLFSYIS